MKKQENKVKQQAESQVKSFYNEKVKPFFSSNQLLLAALGGVAVGIAIASLIGSDKAKEVFESVQSNVKDLASNVVDGIKSNATTAKDTVKDLADAVPAS